MQSARWNFLNPTALIPILLNYVFIKVRQRIYLERQFDSKNVFVHWMYRYMLWVLINVDCQIQNEWYQNNKNTIIQH